MRTWMGGVLGLALLTGCGTVSVAQRDGCWVRHSEGFLRQTRDEVGPCARREPRWSEDRVARLVQECMAEADYRWESEALSAWNKGQPLPAQASEQTVMRACMNDAATAVVTENEGLRKRLAELEADRNNLRVNAQTDLEHLRATEDRMTDALGEAAKKPAPSAYATSSSTGTASTESQPAGASPTSVTVTTPVMPAVPVPVAAPPSPRGQPVPRSERLPPDAACRASGQGGTRLCPASKGTLAQELLPSR